MNSKEPSIKSSFGKHAGTTRMYFVVWISLLVLTVLTVATANLNLAKLAIIVCLVIATVKSILVLLYFMHLRQEKLLVIKLIIPIAIVTLAIFIGLTYSDILTR